VLVVSRGFIDLCSLCPLRFTALCSVCPLRFVALCCVKVAASARGVLWVY